MAGPVITTLLTTNPASGTVTTDGTEQSFTSGTASGSYYLELETNNMVDGDQIEIRGYIKPGASSTKRQCIYNSLSNLQSDPGYISGILPTPGYIEFSIKRIAGSDRSYKWAIINCNGT
jgi:hypothetical protein